MKRRISFLIDSLGHGGAERILDDVAHGLAARGHDVSVDVVTDRVDDAHRRSLSGAGVAVRTYGARRTMDPRAWKRLSDRYRAEPVDVIHTQLEAADVIGTVIGHRLGIPTVSTQHVFSAAAGRRADTRTMLQHRVVRSWSFRTLAVSMAGQRHLVDDHGYDPARVEVVYNGVELVDDPQAPERRSAARRMLGLSHDTNVVVACSVLREEKGIQYLIAAMPTIARRCPAARLVVLGAGPYEAELRAVAAELEVTDITVFAGHRDDVVDLLAAADVFCHPSLRDVLPTAIIEAMSMSLPIVASDTGGIPELVEDGRSGLLVQPGDPGALAEAVCDLLDDPATAERYGARARERAEDHFGLSSQLDGLERIYLSARC
jgi:glycosyltransferase involved in cell wall biosynthesis